MMWDIQEGSILDPYAFVPRPKKPLPMNSNKYEVQRLREERRLLQTKNRFNKSNRKPSRVFKGAFGIVQTYQKYNSPSYQLGKARRQLKEYEAQDRLRELQAKINKRKADERAERQGSRTATIRAIKEKLGFKEEIGIPRANYNQDRLDETKKSWLDHQKKYRHEAERWGTDR